MTRDFYKIKDEMTAEHKQYLKNLIEAKDKTEAEFKVQADKYDKLCADKNVEIVALDTRKKSILKDMDNARLEISALKQEKAALENKVHALRITLQGEEVAFKAKIDAWEKEKEKILEDRRKEKQDNAKLRAECEAERMAGQAKEKNAEKILAQAQDVKAESFRVKNDVDKQIEESRKIREEVVAKLVTMEEDKKVIASHAERHKADIDFIENEKKRLNDLLFSVESREAELKEMIKTYEDKVLDLDLRESELRKTSDRVSKLIEIHKLKVK